MTLTDKILNYPDNARVIITWHDKGRWSEDSWPVGELRKLVTGDEPKMQQNWQEWQVDMREAGCEVYE